MGSEGIRVFFFVCVFLYIYIYTYGLMAAEMSGFETPGGARRWLESHKNGERAMKHVAM